MDSLWGGAALGSQFIFPEEPRKRESEKTNNVTPKTTLIQWSTKMFQPKKGSNNKITINKKDILGKIGATLSKVWPQSGYEHG